MAYALDDTVQLEVVELYVLVAREGQRQEAEEGRDRPVDYGPNVRPRRVEGLVLALSGVAEVLEGRVLLATNNPVVSAAKSAATTRSTSQGLLPTTFLPNQ